MYVPGQLVKTSLKKLICVLSNLIASTKTRSICQMQATFPGVEFLKTLFNFIQVQKEEGKFVVARPRRSLMFKCTKIRWVHNYLTRALALITSSLKTKGFLSNWTKFSLLVKKEKEYNYKFSSSYRVFSHDITAAILVSQTSPVGVEFFSYVNALFCSNKFA